MQKPGGYLQRDRRGTEGEKQTDLDWEISSVGRGTLLCLYICVIEAIAEGHGV